MNNVLEWVKSNLLIVIFCVVMLAAAVVLPMMAGGMNAKVKDELNANVSKYDQLKNLESSRNTVSLSGMQISLDGPVNLPTIEQLKQLTEETKADAQAVVSRAVEHNRKGRTVMAPRLFPHPDPTGMEVLPKRFHDRLVAAYQSLLADAGTPASTDSMLLELQRAEKMFRETKLNVAADAELSEEDTEKLKEHLTEVRVSMYRDAARDITMYASIDSLPVPAFSPTASILEMFNWQWRYWITEDIVKALQSANAEAESVLDAPVKLIFNVVPGVPVRASTSSGGNTGFPGQSMGNDPGMGMTDTPGGPIQPDYSASFITGRTTNSMYDVVDATVELIAETARIPDVIDAISAYNFMTVTNVEFTVAEPYEYVTYGFIFGNEPISRLTLTVETVWLRSWTTPLMPKEVKAALDIPTQDPATDPMG